MKPKTHKKLTHCYNSSQIQHATNWETEWTVNGYGTWTHPIRKQGSPRKTQLIRSATWIRQYTLVPNWKNPDHLHSQRRTVWTTLGNTW